MSKRNEVVDARNWNLPDPKIMIAKLNGQIARNKGNLKVSGDALRPVDFYCYLKARFGEPNGFAMTLRDPSSDNLIQWNYTLMCRENVIEIWGKTAQIEIFVEWFSTFRMKSWETLFANIKSDFQNYGTRMSEIRNGLERWRLFVNPYTRLKTTIDLYSSRLRELRVDEVRLPEDPIRSKDSKSFYKELQTCIEIYKEASALAMSLRMIVPVLAESFINLLIFVLRKRELREDERLYENFIRQPIDVRVKGLHLHCDGFAKGIVAHAKQFKDFQTLMNSRNDFLHGNVDPAGLALDEVFFDGTIPLFKESQSFARRALGGTLQHIEPTAALRDLEVVQAFETFVLDHLQTRMKPQIKMILRDRQPGWREDTKKVGVLLPSQVYSAFLY
jgi:hypothetical protein